MLRRLRQFVIAVMFGALGAVAGRLAADFRRQQAAGEQPSPPNMDGINIKPQDIVPGIVAAMRMTSRPWSWLHIPPWFAAFAVNFGIVAFAEELQSIQGMGRDALGSAGGFGAQFADEGQADGLDDETWGRSEPAPGPDDGAGSTTGAAENGAGAPVTPPDAPGGAPGSTPGGAPRDASEGAPGTAPGGNGAGGFGS